MAKTTPKILFHINKYRHDFVFAYQPLCLYCFRYSIQNRINTDSSCDKTHHREYIKVITGQCKGLLTISCKKVLTEPCKITLPCTQILAFFVPPAHNQIVSLAPRQDHPLWKMFLPTTATLFINITFADRSLWQRCSKQTFATPLSF